MKVSPRQFLFIVSLAVGGAAIVFGVLGFLYGSGSVSGIFSVTQQKFIEGVVAGVELRIEFEEWKSEKNPPLRDVRSEPLTRCAGRFFTDPIRMAGCAQGIEPPPTGYQIPNR